MRLYPQTQDGDQVAEQNADDDEDQEQAMGIWVSGLLSYQGRQVGPKGEKRYARRIQERRKMLQNLGSEG